MIYIAAKILRAICFVAMVLYGVTSVPQLIFLLFLPFSDATMPAYVVKDVLLGFLYFFVAGGLVLALSSWIRKRDEVFY